MSPKGRSRGRIAPKREAQSEVHNRKVDELFARYGESHRNPTNKAIHWICVPLITWSVIALLWSWTPIAAYALIALSVAFYAYLSPAIAIGMLACGALMFLSMYVVWSQAHRVDSARRAQLDHDVPRSLIGVVLIGAVLAFVFPETMAVIAFGISVCACSAYFAMEQTIKSRTDR